MWAILCHSSLFYFNCEYFYRVFFFTKFQVETTIMVRCVKIAPHSSTDIFPSDFQMKSSQLTTLKQFSLSLVPHLHFPGSSCFLSAAHLHQYSLLCTPVYLEKLTSLSFLMLGNVKATLYPKTNLRLIKQTPLLKWAWPCRRNVYKESGSSMTTFWHAEFLSAAALQPLCFNSHTFANTSKKFICNAVTCNQPNYLCSFNNEKYSLL